MNGKDLLSLGVRGAEPLAAAWRACAHAARGGLDRDAIRRAVASVTADPAASTEDPLWGELARALVASPQLRLQPTKGRFQIWGTGLDAAAIEQMRRACSLPVTARGALMPDAHPGYGLPIGGVLAVRDAVIPYAVGVDIACRMKLSVVDLPARTLDDPRGRRLLAEALERETRFGVGAQFQQPREHPVLDEDWGITPVTARLRDRAAVQLGTSGSGNHFVEWGLLTVTAPPSPTASSAPDGGSHGAVVGGSGWDWALQPGRYLALLSHSGSRGAGSAVAGHYSALARRLHPELPRELAELAWLDLPGGDGQEYIAAMNLMGRYASASHACIHRAVAEAVGASVIAGVENHHNFAWIERHDAGDGSGPRDLVVHRKGATPAFAGVMGVIPGSMATPGWVVRGLGNPRSLMSASHGAGRCMSRTKAQQSLDWPAVRRQLADAGVEVLSCGIDEAPGVYKDIEAVMDAQCDLVEPVARFDPKIVKMAPAGERPED